MVSSGTIKIILHITGWLLFFGLMIAFTASSPGGGDVLHHLLSFQYLLFYSVYLFVFYFNSGFLIPRFYLQQEYFYYFLIVGVLFLGVYFLQPFDHLLSNRPQGFGRPENFQPGEIPPAPRGRHIDIVSIILFIMAWSVSTALQIIRQWRSTEERAARAETDKAQAELSFLKAQINPHFLFNTLNNIYSLAVAKSEKTGASIMKLSNIMRYVTDEVTQDFVPLLDEVNCASDYIDLQRMRLSNKVYVDFSVTGNLEGKKIAPLILMTFIENVFKYGISNHEQSTIAIRLFAEERSITFLCQNKLFETQRKAERMGIGLANTRQRLEHLYPGKYFLNISSEKGFYTVQLTVQV